jgi:large subunit ribosomal protein L22
MEIKSYSKYMRISPKKAREVARILPGRKATEGVSLLKYIPRKAARMLNKTLRSAMANAENNANLNADDLTILEAIVEEGPALKRFRPCARGSAHPYKKRMSHLRITLTDEKI